MFQGLFVSLWSNQNRSSFMIEYFAANLWQAWAIIAVICLILELTSGDFFFCSFAIGAVAAAITAPFSIFWIQLAVFAIVSVVSIFWFRPLALRYLHRGEENRASNYDAIVGRKGRVSMAIPAQGFGRVAIDGDDWKAQAANKKEIAEGETVRVVAIDSIIITVEKE